MKQLENSLIDNSFEDRIIDNLDYNRSLSFEEIIQKYKENFISKRQNMLFSYYRYNKPYITNQEILDRNIFILKNIILYNKSYKEIAKYLDLCHTSVLCLYRKALDDIKLIIKNR